MVMEAINTLEAVQRHPPVTALYERLCSPSSSPEARKLCERYTQLAFAKVRAPNTHIYIYIYI